MRDLLHKEVCGKKQLGLILIDMILVIASGFLALAMRFDIGEIPGEYLTTLLIWMPFNLLLTVSVFWLMHLYHGIWALVSIDDIVNCFKAVVLISLGEMAAMLMTRASMPRSYYIMNAVFLFGMTAGIRISLRILLYYKKPGRKKNVQHRTMIIGAGSAGYILMRELNGNSMSQNRPVCLIDDDPEKAGSYMRGIKIAGGREMIPEAVKEYDVEEILIAIPSVSAGARREIIDICNTTDCTVKILPEIAKTLKGMLSTSIREVGVQDLIGREAVSVNEAGLQNFLTGKVVLVTGGGGSIGSELCRQIMSYGAGKLIIFDIYENNAYEIQQELIRQYDNEKIETLIGSVRDYDKLEQVFEQYRPDVVYHAAAHKHVPLMEEVPAEAVKNNCMGTLNAVRLSNLYGVSSFILISTDKAVRPTSVMGATKRICEMIVQSYARHSKTKFAAVRFGNVLGSNGSVVPLFLKQIDEGGPVTVTDKEITRFFMTIPEAVSLVLQAGIYARGGEIFVLDMGKPVKIYELAKSLIKMKGLRPGEDIQIAITGLRPGEKLYEEVLMEEEGLQKTENELIYIGRPLEFDRTRFDNELAKLILAANNNVEDIRMQIAKVCDTYEPEEALKKNLLEYDNLAELDRKRMMV